MGGGKENGRVASDAVMSLKDKKLSNCHVIVSDLGRPRLQVSGIGEVTIDLTETRPPLHLPQYNAGLRDL